MTPLAVAPAAHKAPLVYAPNLVDSGSERVLDRACSGRLPDFQAMQKAMRQLLSTHRNTGPRLPPGAQRAWNPRDQFSG